MMAVEAVRALPDEAWQTVRPPGEGNLGLMPGEVWVRMALNGAPGAPDRQVIELAFARTDFVDWHVFRDGKPDPQVRAGTMRQDRTRVTFMSSPGAGPAWPRAWAAW